MLIVLALLLFAVAGAAVYVVAADGTGDVLLDSFGLNTDVPVWGVFVAGAVTMLVVLAGLVVLTAGLRAARARRTEIRYLRQKVAHQDLAEDRAAAADRSAVGGRSAVADRSVVADRPATTMPAGAADTSGVGRDGTPDAPAGEDGRPSRLSRWRRRRTDDSNTDTGKSTSSVSARP
ncbi:hypothetical protein [Jiangella alba]|uniref:Lipopolysaccharide assembly protein A domain-containing protein n=1 Tax=Jiangella alba TaxID=561176 RepID=A0A1H5PQ93_9ACTN|nr:hypothetical protein [Jiangella alba]SEF16000.1 hypothetical protein SAMN04488561_5176 [Jiangella alba]